MKSLNSNESLVDRSKLTVREEQVMDLICEGNSHKKIQAKLGLGESTVKLYITSLSKKLEITNRYKMKAIIKKVTGKKYLRWRNDKQFLMDTATSASIKLEMIEDINNYIIIDEYGNDVTHDIAWRVHKKKRMIARKKQK